MGYARLKERAPRGSFFLFPRINEIYITNMKIGKIIPLVLLYKEKMMKYATFQNRFMLPLSYPRKKRGWRHPILAKIRGEKTKVRWSRTWRHPKKRYNPFLQNAQVRRYNAGL